MKFEKRLRQAMDQLGLTQSQISGMTGIGKPSISQYLSGKNVPTEQRRKEMAVALGLNPDYFEEEADPVVKLVRNGEGKIPRLLPEDVAKLMSLGSNTVRYGLQQGVFPWGYAVKTSVNPETGKATWSYFINAKRFAEIEGIQV